MLFPVDENCRVIYRAGALYTLDWQWRTLGRSGLRITSLSTFGVMDNYRVPITAHGDTIHTLDFSHGCSGYKVVEK